MIGRLIATFSVATMIAGSAHAADLHVKAGESIQAAVNKAKPGDHILVHPGTYKETVYIDKNNITLSGVPENGKFPVMDGEDKLNDGILVAGHGVTVDHFFVRRFKGNGIMTQGANNFKITDNVVEGSSVYGIFPQYSNNGLVARNTLWAVHDAAIYVGMCQNVDVIDNETFASVIGIEIENSSDILVEANSMHDNTMGALVTLLPGLPVKTAERTVLRRNVIFNNNVPNFGVKGSSVANAPAGTGIMWFAADAGVIEGNVIRGNKSAAIVFADHAVFPGSKDPKMDPNPDRARIADNLIYDNGAEPMEMIKMIVAQAGLTKGVDILSSGPGVDNCVKNMSQFSTLNMGAWKECDAKTRPTFAAKKTMQLAKPVMARSEPESWRGEFAYKAVCSGCHAYKRQLLGPPMITIKALYKDNPKAMADWIAHPTRKRTEFPEMPPQNYLSEDVRMAVAKYILNDLKD